MRNVLSLIAALLLCGCTAELRLAEERARAMHARELAEVERERANALEAQVRDLRAEVEELREILAELEKRGLLEIRKGTPSARETCLHNLKQLGFLALLYADDSKNVFPTAKGPNPPSHASLQLLVDYHGTVQPELFVCPASGKQPAKKDANGQFTLSAETTSYAWLGKRTKSTSPADWAIGACLHHRDEGGINVVYAGMNVEWVEGGEMPKRLVDVNGNSIGE